MQGMDYDLPTPTTQVFEEAVVMALRYSTLLTRKPGQTPQPARLRELLAKLTTQFSRTEAERVALEDAGAYCITEDRLDRDIAHLPQGIISRMFFVITRMFFLISRMLLTRMKVSTLKTS